MTVWPCNTCHTLERLGRREVGRERLSMERVKGEGSVVWGGEGMGRVQRRILFSQCILTNLVKPGLAYIQHCNELTN